MPFDISNFAKDQDDLATQVVPALNTSPRVRTMLDETAVTVTFTDNASSATTITNAAAKLASCSAATTISPTAPFVYQASDVAATSSFVVPLGVTADNFSRTVNQQGGVTQVWFDVDLHGANANTGFEIELFLQSAGVPSAIRVWLNEKASAWHLPLTPNATRTLKIDPGAAGYYRVMIEFENLINFGGVYVAKTDMVYPPTVKQTSKLAIVGDSYAIGEGAANQGTNANVSASGFAFKLARALGFASHRVYAQGGTGFIANPSGGTGGNNSVTSYPRRISDPIGYAPDVVIVQGSLNDHDQPTLPGPATSYLQSLRAALPRAKIVLTSPLFISVNGAYVATGAQLAGVAASLSIPYVDIIDGGYFNGTGNTGAQNGDGTADYYQSTVASHPSQAGHNAFARAIATVAASMLTLGV